MVSNAKGLTPGDLSVPSLVGLTRILHMFTGIPGEPLDSNAANDTSAFVSLYVHDELETAFTLPVMSVAFSWSCEMLEAVVTFCKYQMDQAT